MEGAGGGVWRWVVGGDDGESGRVRGWLVLLRWVEGVEGYGEGVD